MSSSFHYTRLPTVLMGASNAPMPTDKKRLSHKLPRKADRPDSNQKTLIVRAVLSLLAIFTCVWLDAIRHKFFVFDPTHLHELAQSAVASASSPNAISEMIPYIIANLTATYSTKAISINTATSEWMLNNAGGAMGAMYIIHASITEYLIIFGTPLGTEGHTGLHTADDYFNILVGEQWAFDPSKSLEKEVYKPGMVHYLPRGKAKQYKMHEGCFALEYARGWIPLMVPFALADGLTSTLDIPTLLYTMRVTSREIFKNIVLGKI